MGLQDPGVAAGNRFPAPESLRCADDQTNFVNLLHVEIDAAIGWLQRWCRWLACTMPAVLIRKTEFGWAGKHAKHAGGHPVGIQDWRPTKGGSGETAHRPHKNQSLKKSARLRAARLLVWYAYHLRVGSGKSGTCSFHKLKFSYMYWSGVVPGVRRGAEVAEVPLSRLGCMCSGTDGPSPFSYVRYGHQRRSPSAWYACGHGTGTWSLHGASDCMP